MHTDGAIARLRELDRGTVVRVLEVLRNVHPHDLKRPDWENRPIEGIWVEFFYEIELRVKGEQP